MNKKFHQYGKYFVIKFSAQVAAVHSTFAHVRYNIYFHDFVEGEMIRRHNIGFVVVVIIIIIIIIITFIVIIISYRAI
jgi:uncharacterized membrane protein YidH (DUF202 family)